MTNLASLYAEYKKNLKKNDLVMQDDILSVPLQIEAIVRGLVGPVKISDTTKGKYQNNGPLKDSLEYEASVIHELIGKDFTTYDLLEGIENRQKEVREILSEKSYKEICEELGITYRLHTDGKDRPFVPTKGKDKAPITGSGSGWEKEKKSPKLLELISLLGRIETPEGGRVDTRDILVDFQSETPDSMMRTLPYVVVRIPRLSRTILIDDRIGEATFVLEGLTDLSIITSNHKGELETHHGAKKVIYDAKWKDNLMRYLMTDWNETGKEEKNTPTPRVDVDMASLFMDAETIRVNLEKFAEVEGIEISELSTINPNRNTEVTLSNGVRMKWRIFLNNASKYLLGTRNRGDNPHRQAEALYKLSETSGQISMNEQYFRNITYVKMDLEAFATAAGVPIRELSTNPLLSNIEVILSNGVKMKWRTFLNNASKYIYLTSSELGKNTHGKAETLDKLYGIIGVDRVKRESLTGEYFLEKNIENIRIDLQSFADMAGIQITELTTTTPKGNTKIILSNGIKRRWIDFLLNASKYLSGTEKGSDNPHRLAESLERLLKMLALKREKRELWTGEYFSDSNKEKLRKDIERYAQVGKVRIKELSTNTPKENTEVELSNGVEMKWGRFLRNASNFLLGTKNNSKESLPRKSEALDRLCEMVGIVREKQQFLSKEYFDVLNEENIRSDLEKYAEAGGVRIEKISTGTPEGNTEITLSNGARMKWNTFLMNASQHLLGTKQRSKENPPRKSDALYKLCEITGVVRAKKPKS